MVSATWQRWMLLRARLSSSPCARGIKAIKVVAKEGGKANGEVTIVGVKKRVVFGLVLVATVVAVCFTLAVNEGKQFIIECLCDKIGEGFDLETLGL